MRILFLLVGLLCGSVFAKEYQVIGGCTSIVLEGGMYKWSPDFPQESCPLNYWVISRTYEPDGKTDRYQCGTIVQACNLKVEIPEVEQ